MNPKPKTIINPHTPKAHHVYIEFHNDHAQAVFIAGTFNDWRPDASPMISLGHGRWAKELSLQPGRYEYRLVMDGQWICDPSASEKVANPFDGCNAVLIVPQPTSEASNGHHH